jgi:hypothetical protein
LDDPSVKGEARGHQRDKLPRMTNDASSKRARLLDETRAMLALARHKQPTMQTAEKKQKYAGIIAVLEEIELIILNADDDNEIEIAAQQLGVALERLGIAD